MGTDVGTELSVPMDMIMPNIPFSLLTAYQTLAIDGVRSRFGVWFQSSPSCVYQCVSAHILDMIAPGFFFDYCGANFNRKHS